MARTKIPKASEMMQRRLVTVQPDDEIQAAVRKLIGMGYSGAPVVDADGGLLGVLSEHDCIRVMTQALAEGWPGGRVAQQMTREIETVTPDEDAFAISTHFTQGAHRRLLVVDDGRLIGLISRRDLMKALAGMEKAVDHAHDKSTYEVISERRRKLD